MRRPAINKAQLSAPLGKLRGKSAKPAQSPLLQYLPYGILGLLVSILAIVPLVVNDPDAGEMVAKMGVEVPRFEKSAKASVEDMDSDKSFGDSKKKSPNVISNGTTIVRKIEQPTHSQNNENNQGVVVTDPSQGGNQGVVVTDPSSGQIIEGAELQNNAGVKMRAAPDPRLVQKTPVGLLPVVGNDSSKAYRVYARPASTARSGSKSVKIAIIVGGLGLSASSTQSAITKLPGEVTLAFAPYGSNLQGQVNKARTEGHEVLLQIPLEPFDYPSSDPGPQTLLTTLTSEQNQERLRWFMSRFSGYIGIVNYMGGKFTAQDTLYRPILQEIRDRGLLYADDGSSTRSRSVPLSTELKMPFAKSDLVIDLQPTPDAIDARLSELEAIAYRQGIAIGSATALPITVDHITEWTNSLSRRGITLIPLSAAVTGTQ